MWIDTHVHFDAPEFDATRANDWTRARDAGVSAQIVPAVSPDNFETVRAHSVQFSNTFYALGIHPMYVMGLPKKVSIELLRSAVVRSMNDDKFIAIGEIGLDGFVSDVDWDTQVWFLREQLNIAREFDLPVLLHVRRSVDKVSKYLREFNIQKGIAHAFNGSFEQAYAYIEMGLHLGFGGTLTFERARQIRRLASELPLSSLVIETDAPDIPPTWLNAGEHNYSHHLPRIAHTLAELRGLSHEVLAQSLWQNTLNALPRLAQVLPADI
ncbi:MAG: yjjV [Burkholderiaceae bacterium]|nr:yjjV [Burkholderiaceae bacterium]